jgi:uncharacterized protein YifE (UPF0438 family)
MAASTCGAEIRTTLSGKRRPPRAILRPMDEARFAALIRRHLPFYRALAEGARPPTTPAQRRFVAVARGEAEPETEHERAFLRWREAVARADRALAEEGRARFSADPTAAAEARLRLSRKRP